MVEFGEEYVFVGRKFVVTVRQGEALDLWGVRRRMERETDLLRWGPAVILYAIMDYIVDHYIIVVAGLEDEIETSVFDAYADVSRRTYELSREVFQFPRAVKPITGILTAFILEFAGVGRSEGGLNGHHPTGRPHDSSCVRRGSGAGIVPTACCRLRSRSPVCQRRVARPGGQGRCRRADPRRGSARSRTQLRKAGR